MCSKLIIIYIWEDLVVCMYVCVTRMDGQTACLISTKIWEWIAIHPGVNIGGLKFTPHLSKWSPPSEVDLKNLPDETRFLAIVIEYYSGAS